MTSSKTGLSLIDDLNKLKSRVESIESDLKFQGSNINVRDRCWDTMQTAMKKTINDNKNKKEQSVKLDVGGVKFQTTKETLLTAKNSLFEAILNDPDFANLNSSQELFFDRSPDYFVHILNYLRTGTINYTQFKKAQKKLLLEEAKYYQILPIVEYLEERMKDIELVSFEFKGPYIYKGQVAGTNLLEDVKNDNMDEGAICSAVPGEITFTLNSDWEFKELDIAGFKGNSKLWYPENGVGANISTSLDGKDWKKVGKIPSGFGKELKTVKLTTSTGKYIKFHHTSYLGIAYLKIKKMDEEE